MDDVPVKGAPPCLPHLYRARERHLQLTPYFFKSGVKDLKPTGSSWARRLAAAQRIWDKLGVRIKASSPTVWQDEETKVGGSTEQGVRDIGAKWSGMKGDVFLVDNPMTKMGGGRMDGPGYVVMSDGGSSNTLLAHEICHVLGVAHPNEGGGELGTIAQTSGSHDAEQPDCNTLGNYAKIKWPAGKVTCIDPDPASSVNMGKPK